MVWLVVSKKRVKGVANLQYLFRYHVKPSAAHMTIGSRVNKLDYIRCLAILLVVVCHCNERLYGKIAAPQLRITLSYSAFFALGRIGVPLFLFLTGSLVLSKLVKGNDDVASFYKRKLLPLVVSAALCTAFYYVRSILILDQPFDIFQAFRILLLLENCPRAVLWYLPMIIGIYIALPFVAVVFRNFTFRSFSLPLGVLLLVQFVLPFVSNISVVFGFSPIAGNSALDISFLGGAYGFYIIFGYFVQSGAFDINNNSRAILTAGVTSFLFLVVMLFISTTYQRGYVLWYSDLLLLIASCCLYLLLFSYLRLRRCHVIELISRASFGIYLVHYAVIDLFQSPFIAMSQMGALGYFASVSILSVTVFGVTFLLILAINKVSPKIAALLFLFK